MGGLKRKIDTGKKIDGKNPRAVAFSKRRKGLFNKASELCLLSDAQIAILATPISSNSHASFYSFGHSSVDNVVSAFLAGQTPRRDEDDDDDEKLGFWWEDESLGNSQNPEELGCAIDSMRKMLHDLKELKNKQRDRVDVTHQQQTLDHQPCSSSLFVDIDDDVSVNVQGFHNNNTEEQQQALAVSGSFDEELDVDDIWKNLELDDLTVNLQGFQNNTDEEQTLANDDGLHGSFDGCNQEFDIDQLYDFVTKSEDLWKDMEMYDDCLY